jgi:hypothetical protein
MNELGDAFRELINVLKLESHYDEIMEWACRLINKMLVYNDNNK